MNHGAPGRARLLLFLGLALLITGSLLVYTLTRRRPPIPADRDHAPGVDAARCLQCHGPSGANARSPRHPLNDQCFNCHERS